MEINKVHHGNCLDLFKELGNESIDMVCTSPPYYQLRDYKWDGQWGLEPTFQLYLEHLWQMMDEVYRVLNPIGTAWINLGDTYGTVSGNISGGNMIDNKIKYTGGIDNYSKQKGFNKCLLLLPHRFAIGCIDRNWIVRNDIVWAKRNGMPESVTDRFSKKHEYFFLMVKQEKYYFDLDGIRDKIKTASLERYKYDFCGNPDELSRMESGRPEIKATTKIPEEQAEMFGSPRARQHRQSNGKSKIGGIKKDGNERSGIYDENEWFPRDDGKNPGSVSDFWDIPTQPGSDEHYAAYNDKLIGKPIIAGCPKGGIILDPFAGTATTGCRALELGRNFIGFDGSEKYATMGNKNLLPYIQQKQLF